MIQLGGRALYIAPDEIKLVQRESVPMWQGVERYVMGSWRGCSPIAMSSHWRNGLGPVINGLSDYTPPAGLTDLLTVQEKLGRLQGVTLAYVGDGNNVLHSLLLGGAKTGMHIVAATPEGYDPLPEVVRLAEADAARTGGSVRLLRDPREAVTGADVVYTDTWISMGQEAETAERRKVFPPYQLNSQLLAHAKPNAA